MLKINKSISDTKKPYNEDLYGHIDSSYWIIDGATGLYKNSIADDITDAQWYVKEIDISLKKRINNEAKSLKVILKECINEVFELYKKQSKNSSCDKELYPSASIIIVRELGDYIEYLSLGDCTLLLNKNDNVIKVLDETVPKLDAILTEELIKKVKEKHISISDAREELSELCKRHRSMKNHKNGYWILEFDEEAIDNAIYDKVNKTDVSDIIIMSDGYYRLYDTFNIYKSDIELINDLKDKNCADLIKIIKELEDSDENCLTYPRTKQRDDITVIYIIEN